MFKIPWISLLIAITITITAAIYQKVTGPTYPQKFSVESNQEKFKIFLPRSHGGETDCRIEIPTLNETATATIFFKRYPTTEEWQQKPFIVAHDKAFTQIPNQPPAGKLQYFVKIQTAENEISLGSESDPIVIRFKGEVPNFILIPHILFMFIAMFLSTWGAIEGVMKTHRYFKISLATVFFLGIGGMILGPIVQKFAFGAYWTGFPYGYDLTDNKTLIAFLAWIIATTTIYKWRRPWPIIISSLILLTVFSIPHSLKGSQLDYKSMKVETAR